MYVGGRNTNGVLCMYVYVAMEIYGYVWGRDQKVEEKDKCKE